MASYYENDILRVLKGADRPLRMREIVDAIAPNNFAAFTNIGNALTHLYRAGRIAREKPGRWFEYTYVKTDEQVQTAIDVLKAYTDDSLQTSLCDDLDRAIEVAWNVLMDKWVDRTVELQGDFLMD
jgi:predicted transcriptional regulator